jgi:hypothetical protein
MMGVNDAQTGANLNVVSIPQFIQFLGLTAGAGIKTYIQGPLCWGELNPSGLNVADAAIVALDDAMAVAAAAFQLCAFRSVRRAVFNPVEAAQNFIAQANPGTLTRPDSVSKGHPNPNGRALCDAFITIDCGI